MIDTVPPDTDQVFKALADPTRRRLLDRLRGRNGQTLRELCEDVGMTRQSATQHLALLEASNLVSTRRRGREKLHYLNPVPIHEIQERWIAKFEHPRLRMLSSINLSEWQAGSRWEHRRTDGSGIADVVGTVLESTPPRRLVSTWTLPGSEETEDSSRVTFEIEPYGEIVRLTVIHENLADAAERETASAGWAAVMSNLKSLLETGHVLPQAPWEMPHDTAATSS